MTTDYDEAEHVTQLRESVRRFVAAEMVKWAEIVRSARIELG